MFKVLKVLTVILRVTQTLIAEAIFFPTIVYVNVGILEINAMVSYW